MRPSFLTLAKVITPPCKPDCPDRTAGCHSKCQKYIDYKAEMEEEKIKMRKAYEAENGITDYEYSRLIRGLKRRGKHGW